MGIVLKILEEKDAHRPETGFNICGLDEYEHFGERIYFIQHADTLEEAEKLVIDLKKKIQDDIIILESNEEE